MPLADCMVDCANPAAGRTVASHMCRVGVVTNGVQTAILPRRLQPVKLRNRGPTTAAQSSNSYSSSRVRRPVPSHDGRHPIETTRARWFAHSTAHSPPSVQCSGSARRAATLAWEAKSRPATAARILRQRDTEAVCPSLHSLHCILADALLGVHSASGPLAVLLCANRARADEDKPAEGYDGCLALSHRASSSARDRPPNVVPRARTARST